MDETRSCNVALAALAWTIPTCVFGLPDLSGGTDWRHALLFPLAPGWSWSVVTRLILLGRRRYPFPARDLPDEFWRISFRACRLRLSTRDSERKHVDHAGSGGIGKRWAAREDLYAIERLADGYRAPHPLSEARLCRPGRLATGSKSRVAHHQVAVVKRWANQDRSKIIFADSGQLASHGQS